MLRHLTLAWVAALALANFVGGVARADDAFYAVQVTRLTITEGELPKAEGNASSRYQRAAIVPAMQPYATIDGADGEAYVRSDVGEIYYHSNVRPEQLTLTVRAPAGQPVTGRIAIPNAGFTGMTTVRFKVAADAADPKASDAFFTARAAHYDRLLSRDVPGAAWFRHEYHASLSPLGQRARDEAQRQRMGRRSGNDLADTYNLFTGGRALSENLQLDRALVLRDRAEPADVAIDTLKGVTVEEMDWKKLIAGAKPELDPLAAVIPADQHAIFFPSFGAFTALADEAERQGGPLLMYAEPRSEDAMTKERYQKQLCLPLTAVGRVLGPTLIASVALTGSDPYLRVGTDVAVVFEAKDVKALHAAVAAQVMMNRGTDGRAKVGEGNVAGVAYTSAVSSDRAVSSYVAAVGNAVVVTNSLKQLERLVAAHKGTVPALASLDEYAFFRDRYKRGDADETGFLILTDATIRRWCSPRWRIADSRRTRAAAVMMELQATHFNDLVGGRIRDGVVQSEFSAPDAGEMFVGREGVTSAAYNGLDFMTPIVEVDMAKVTKAEADAYNQWRDTYQQNWSRFFDPIAVRFTVRDERLAADVSILPLILATQYKELAEVTRGAKLAPGAADPHDAIVQWAVALNKDSPPVKQVGGFMKGMLGDKLKVEPLAWVGDHLTIYADDDTFWAEMANAADPQKFLTDNFSRIPVAAQVGVSNPLALTVFLTGLHAFVDQSAPGMTQWNTLKHRDQPYVRIGASEPAKAQAGEFGRAALYYVAAPDALILTLNEEVLKRAIDRRAERAAAAAKAAKAAPATRPWLGESMALQADRRLLTSIELASRDEYQAGMQARAWGNLPILNEWKRRYPGEDPLKVHERFWQVRLVDPAGGRYVWNEKEQTMESSVYGHPAAPKEGPPLAAVTASLLSGNFGVTFENNGLRAKAVLERQPATPARP